MTRSRVFLGQDVDVVRENGDGIELDGRARLRPGFIVELVRARTHRQQSPARPALVLSWKIRSLGRDGPIYRGFCRWDTVSGNELPQANGSTAQYLAGE